MDGRGDDERCAPSKLQAMSVTDGFEAERPRLVRLAGRLLRDDAEAEDIVQRAWLRDHLTTGHPRM